MRILYFFLVVFVLSISILSCKVTQHRTTNLYFADGFYDKKISISIIENNDSKILQKDTVITTSPITGVAYHKKLHLSKMPVILKVDFPKVSFVTTLRSSKNGYVLHMKNTPSKNHVTIEFVELNKGDKFY